MSITATATPRVYVGTYAKYNNGPLAGKWFDLEDYAGKDEFIEACQEFHGPGEHEFMFQDFEDIPRKFISESYLKPDVWEAWVELSDEDKELLEVYTDHVHQDGTLEQAQEAFRGKYDSKDGAAEEFMYETGAMEGVPDWAKNHIDWGSVARELEHGDYVFTPRTNGDIWMFRGDV